MEIGGFAEGGVGLGGGEAEALARDDASGGTGDPAASVLELSGVWGALDLSAMDPETNGLRNSGSYNNSASAGNIL